MAARVVSPSTLPRDVARLTFLAELRAALPASSVPPCRPLDESRVAVPVDVIRSTLDYIDQLERKP